MQQQYRVIVVPRAAAEIQRICSYIAARSPQGAEIVAIKLFEAIDSLNSMPQRFRIHERRRDPDQTVHATAVDSYIVYYRISETQGVVRVLSVWHGARRQPKRFR